MVPKLNISSLLAGLLLLYSPLSSACPGEESYSNLDIRTVITSNIAARQASHATHHIPRQEPTKLAIDNVRVFNGYSLSDARTVVIKGSQITDEDCQGAHHIDGRGASLFPGFIDAHIHPQNATHLHQLTRYGVTTGFAMSCIEPQLCASLQNHRGLVNLLITSCPGTTSETQIGKILSKIDPSLIIHNISQVPAWFDRQLSGDPDYFKLIADPVGLSQEELTALGKLAHARGKKIAIHAVDNKGYEQAIVAGLDHIQHAPLDKKLSRDTARRIARNGLTSTPTLTMMRATAQKISQGGGVRGEEAFKYALESVSTMHKVGVPILAGTDANEQAGVPAMVPFGSSIHAEMANLVEAGMSNVEALRAATVVPARHFGLRDRGEVVAGMLADLVLIEGNPLENIKDTQKIVKVWVGGVEYTGQ